jgi:tetratricopeptide (TPR) repeat protein
MNRACWPFAFAVSLLLAGCATDQSARRPAGTGDPIVDGENTILYGPPKDKVLWQYRTALAAMRAGKYDLAKRYFDDALARLSNIYGPDPSARQARSYFQAEARKTFIGEPYERVMAYFYRGILYWMEGEPDNARACFRSAQLMDSDTENKTYAADYVLLDYLDGYITARLGGDGTDAMKRAETSARMWKPPRFSTNANVLVFVDYGPGPTKFATGEFGEQLRFAGGASPVRSARVKINEVTGKAVPYDDLYFQATTRGGRVMDHVLANKAVFKSATDAFGNAAVIGGAVLASGRDTQAAGLAMLGAGLISKLLSAGTTPAADTRAWDNLPLYLSFVALELSPGQHTLTVEFLDQGGKVLAGFTKTITVNVPEGTRDKVIYLSDKSITPQTL